MKLKQVILIRRDLKMRRGKEIAQGSHASMAFLRDDVRSKWFDPTRAVVTLSPVQKQWLIQGSAKVCLQVRSEEELIRCHEQALEAGLTSHMVRDAGKTEFGGVPTLTACAIGPNEAGSIDEVTGALKLY